MKFRYLLVLLAFLIALPQVLDAKKKKEVTLTYSKSLKAADTEKLQLPIDKDGYITIFDCGADILSCHGLPAPLSFR